MRFIGLEDGISSTRRESLEELGGHGGFLETYIEVTHQMANIPEFSRLVARSYNDLELLVLDQLFHLMGRLQHGCDT